MSIADRMNLTVFKKFSDCCSADSCSGCSGCSADSYSDCSADSDCSAFQSPFSADNIFLQPQVGGIRFADNVPKSLALRHLARAVSSRFGTCNSFELHIQYAAKNDRLYRFAIKILKEDFFKSSFIRIIFSLPYRDFDNQTR